MNNTCCNSDERRLAVLQHPIVNGIDFIEVADNPSDPDELRQTTLIVHFLKDISGAAIQPSNIAIKGGERISNIIVLEATRADLASAPLPNAAKNMLIIKLSLAGDFSTYQLQLIAEPGNDAPPEGFDPILSTQAFSFKVSCPSEFDCISTSACAPPPRLPKPSINYLAKDYATFRQLMLDRMAVTIPVWKERNPADMGLMLVELLAYAGDYLSYRQDAIATEAYLSTARKRISVKRHVRLTDYHMHDGCNARTWLHVEVAEGISGITLAGNSQGKIKFVTTVPGKPPVMNQDSPEADEIFKSKGYEVFEPVMDVELDSSLNHLNFYNWGKTNCHLKEGATNATLEGHLNGLKGKILVIKEEVSPHTLQSADADRTKRHAVRVVAAEHIHDILVESQTTLSDPKGRAITRITWHEEDALPYAFCLNTMNKNGETVIISNLLGNIVLADHGNTVSQELHYTFQNKQPVLEYAPLTNGKKQDIKITASASAMMHLQPANAVPHIFLKEKNEAALLWQPAKDLVSSRYNSRDFVIEVENNGTTSIRFGNGQNGQMPVHEMRFDAQYRTGNGERGNIATGSLTHLLSMDANLSRDTIVSIENVTPGFGGAEPETIEEVKYRAPIAFRKQERAVTASDYEEKARAYNKNIQRSAATLRWTGSWRTVFLSVDTLSRQAFDDSFINGLEENLEKYRLAGQDLQIETPDYVPLEIEIDICVLPHYSRAHVKAAILQKLSNRHLPGGETGAFHPDNFTFGQPVYLSRIYSEIQMQPGVASVTIKKFQRLGVNSAVALNSGKVSVGRTEIARLDNDPNALENGIININMSGGN